MPILSIILAHGSCFNDWTILMCSSKAFFFSSSFSDPPNPHKTFNVLSPQDKSKKRKFLSITEKHHNMPPWFGLSLRNICVTNDHGYVPLVVNTSRSFPRSWLTTGFVTRLTRRVSLEEQELLTFPGHLSSPRFCVGFVLLDR